MPGQDANFTESPGAGGSDVREGVGLGEQVPRIAVDLGEHDQSDGEISGSVEDYGKQGQHRRRNTEKSATDAGSENFISPPPPEATGGPTASPQGGRAGRSAQVFVRGGLRFS